MALRWEWNEKIGELTMERNGEEFTLHLYQGNALLIALHEWTNKEGNEVWQMGFFFADKGHFQNWKKDKTDNYAEGWKKITLWEVPNDLWQVLKDAHKRGVTIEIKGKEQGK